MPDRLAQTQDTKLGKTLLTIGVVLVALNVLLFLFVPTQQTISRDEDAIIYSLSDEGFEAPCHVTLDGTLTQSVLLKDSFEGRLSVSGASGPDEQLTLRLTRENGAWEGQLLEDDGALAASCVLRVQAAKDFSHIVIAFAPSFDPANAQSALSADGVLFLSLGSPNRAYALRQYQELILK